MPMTSGAPFFGGVFLEPTHEQHLVSPGTSEGGITGECNSSVSTHISSAGKHAYGISFPKSLCVRTPWSLPPTSAGQSGCSFSEDFSVCGEAGGCSISTFASCDPSSAWLSHDFPHLSLQDAGYTFTKEIASVSNGAINLAVHLETGAFRTVKCYNKAHAQVDALEFFMSEAEMLFDLGRHPNIGEAIETFQDDDCYSLVQPYYRGGTLLGLKKRAVIAGVVPNEGWWQGIIFQCLEGLAYMHAQSVMHCDIKETNIMLRSEDLQDPEVVIIDLGVAQRATTKRSIIYGTPGYIPPEVWEAKQWYPQSDAFSLGVVIMQMLISKIGIFSVGANGFKEIKEATQNRCPPFDLMPAEFPSVQGLVQKLLVKDFLLRPTVTEMLEEPWEGSAASNMAQPKNRNSASRTARPQQRCSTMPALHASVTSRGFNGLGQSLDLAAQSGFPLLVQNTPVVATPHSLYEAVFQSCTMRQ